MTSPAVRAHANIRLPHSDRAPRLARAFVADRLQGWNLEAMIEVATLVVSEVVTNAVIHARSDAELSLERTPTALRISVTDHGTGARTPRELELGRRRRPGAHDRGEALDELGCRTHRRGQPCVGRAPHRIALTETELEAPLDANPDELAISHYVSDGALIIEVAGEIDLHTATELQRSVDRLSPFPHPVTLDLAGVGFIDSTGIRALLAINNRASETTGESLKIVNPTDSTRRLLELTGIDKILNLEGASRDPERHDVSMSNISRRPSSSKVWTRIRQAPRRPRHGRAARAPASGR